MPTPDPIPFLSDEWLGALLDVCSSLPARAGATARVSTVVVGGPGGARSEAAYRCDFVDGRVVSAAPGAAPEGEADLVVTQPYDDAVAALRGEAGLDVAFMRGRTKVAGSTNRLLSLLPVLRSDEWRAACDSLAARTAL
jgi:hypothetical protein